MLIPSYSTVRKLFQTHQNQCALRSCAKKIIDKDGHVNGNLFFIQSNNPKKPRYNPELSNHDVIYYHNLILLCDWHGFKTDFDEKEFSVSNLREAIIRDQEVLEEQNFEITEKMFEDILYNFINYHDPDRFAHINYHEPDPDGKISIRDGNTNNWPYFEKIYIKPTKQFVNSKFEIISFKRKIQVYDRVIFYLPEKYEEGVQADIEIKSKMSLIGKVPKLSSGKYLVSLESALDGTSKLETDLKFTIL